MSKQKITLTQEKETLLIPLYSKALEAQRTTPILVDPKAQEILQDIDYDFAKLEVPRQTLVTLAMRAKKLDEYVCAYLAHSFKGLVLHLGCGLDSRVLRTQGEKANWYDLDYPDVIELRRHFYTESAHYHMLASSVTNLSWLDQVKESGPACIVAEGLLMYLHEEEVKRLFLILQQRWPGSEFCFDAYSSLTVKGAKNHPSLKKTGAHLYWGIDDPKAIEGWASGIRLLEEWFFTQSADIPLLPARDRLLFKIMGGFSAAKRAHRILHFQL